MIICGIDLETGGTILGASSILEIAAVLYDTELKSMYKMYSTLVWSSSHLPPSEEALSVNGLSVELLQRHGVDTKEALTEVCKFIDKADALMGHNALSFDKPFLDWELKTKCFKERTTPWIDTRVDLPYPAHMTSKRLSHLATDHGIHNMLPHRALLDVITMIEVARNYDLDEAFKRCKSPLIRIEACVDYETRQKARDARFMWDPEKKVWYKNIREIDFLKESNSVTFSVKRA